MSARFSSQYNYLLLFTKRARTRNAELVLMGLLTSPPHTVCCSSGCCFGLQHILMKTVSFSSDPAFDGIKWPLLRGACPYFHRKLIIGSAERSRPMGMLSRPGPLIGGALSWGDKLRSHTLPTARASCLLTSLCMINTRFLQILVCLENEIRWGQSSGKSLSNASAQTRSQGAQNMAGEAPDSLCGLSLWAVSRTRSSHLLQKCTCYRYNWVTTEVSFNSKMSLSSNQL